MKGKPVSDNGNAVVWANGFRSNMPDWPTARACAVSSEMLYVLKRCRALLLNPETYKGELDIITKLVHDVCAQGDGTVAIKEALTLNGVELICHIPKPPGFA